MSRVRTVLKFSEPLVFKTGLFEFGQGEAEILPKNKLPTFFVDTVYIYHYYSIHISITHNTTHDTDTQNAPSKLFTHKTIRGV